MILLFCPIIIRWHVEIMEELNNLARIFEDQPNNTMDQYIPYGAEFRKACRFTLSVGCRCPKICRWYRIC